MSSKNETSLKTTLQNTKKLLSLNFLVTSLIRTTRLLILDFLKRKLIVDLTV